jgi:hypothetical protein
LDVCPDRGAVQGQRFSDLGVRGALGDEFEYLTLARRDLGETWSASRLSVGVCDDSLDQAPRDGE